MKLGRKFPSGKNMVDGGSSKINKAERFLDMLYADVDTGPLYYEGHNLFNIYNDLGGFLVNYSLFDRNSTRERTCVRIYDVNPCGRKYLEKDYDRYEFNELINKCKRHLHDPNVLRPIPPRKVMNIETGVIHDEHSSLRVIERFIHLLEFHLSSGGVLRE